MHDEESQSYQETGEEGAHEAEGERQEGHGSGGAVGRPMLAFAGQQLGAARLQRKIQQRAVQRKQELKPSDFAYTDPDYIKGKNGKKHKNKKDRHNKDEIVNVGNSLRPEIEKKSSWKLIGKVSALGGDLDQSKALFEFDESTNYRYEINISNIRYSNAEKFVLFWVEDLRKKQKLGAGWVNIDKAFGIDVKGKKIAQEIVVNEKAKHKWMADTANSTAQIKMHFATTPITEVDPVTKKVIEPKESYMSPILNADKRNSKGNRLSHYLFIDNRTYNVLLNLPQRDPQPHNGTTAAVATDIAANNDEFHVVETRYVPVYPRGFKSHELKIPFAFGYINGDKQRAGWTCIYNLVNGPSTTPTTPAPAESTPPTP